MTDLQLLRTIAERLCQVQTGAESEIRAALAIPIEPAPLGARELEIYGGVLSRATVELKWSLPSAVTKADIDRVFGGTGEPLPRTGPGASHVFAYNVSVAGAPAKISVYASFADKPRPETGAKGVMFRIDEP